MRTVRIGAAEGFYGDSLDAAVETAKRGNIQYLSFDCLAELTMAILAKDRAKDTRLGYTKDITPAMQRILPLAKENDFKILTNAGGLHPVAAGQEVVRIAQELGLKGLKVAVVTGDNIMDRLDEFLNAGISLSDMQTGNVFTDVRNKLMFANVYLGATPIVEALRMGADVVVTGRTTDTAQFLAPLLYEFSWSENDLDALAQGILMGHLMECSAQSTGGNFSGSWWDVADMDRIGYPVAEVQENGQFILTKTEGTGGLVTVDTVKEQMLYEIHDPANYLTPDVIADFTTATLQNLGGHQVLVKGATGKPRPQTLKAVMGYENGYMGQAIIGYAWPDALKKAKAAEAIITKQLKRLKWQYDEIHISYLGYNSLHGPTVPMPSEELNEVYLRIAVRAQNKRDAARFGRLFPPLALNGPPSLGGAAGMEAPRQLMGMWSTLIPREFIEGTMKVSLMEVTE